MDLATAVKCVQPSIVQINFSAHGRAGESTAAQPTHVNRSLGTGFVVSAEGYVVTASHVIQEGLRALDRVESDIKTLSVGFAYPNTPTMRANFTLMPFDLVDTDSIHDIALLRLRGKEIPPMIGNRPPLKLQPVDLNCDRPDDGVAIGVSGYPVNQPVLVTNGGFMATSWAFDIEGLRSRETPEFYRRLETADSYLADINVNPGNSGGPVYLVGDGSVIGMCVGYLRTNVSDAQHTPICYYYNTGLAVMVPARYVCDLLERHTVN